MYSRWSNKIYPKYWPACARRARQRAGHKCEKCGQELVSVPAQGEVRWTRLFVHHIDKDPFNCAPDNLVVVCGPCHKWLEKNYRLGQLSMFREPWEITRGLG